MQAPLVKEINGVKFGKHTLKGQIEKAAWRSFSKHMEGRFFGYHETLDAWQWFVTGWHAHIKGPRHP